MSATVANLIVLILVNGKKATFTLDGRERSFTYMSQNEIVKEFKRRAQVDKNEAEDVISHGVVHGNLSKVGDLILLPAGR